MTRQDFTDEELTLICEALDSHAYWQLSEPEDRNNGYVNEGAETPEILEVYALIEKVEKVRAANTNNVASVNDKEGK